MSFAASVTWNNGAGTNDWNNNDNWDTDAQPGGSDTAVFDGTSTASCTLSVNEACRRIVIRAAYTGNFCLNGKILTTTNPSSAPDSFGGGGSLTLNGTLKGTSSGHSINIHNFSSWLGSPDIDQQTAGAVLNITKDISAYPIKTWSIGLGTAKRVATWAGNAGSKAAVKHIKFLDSTVLQVNNNLYIVNK
jgi:hypothetical protein